MGHLLDLLFALVASAGSRRRHRHRRGLDLRGRPNRDFGGVSWSTRAAAATVLALMLPTVVLTGRLLLLAAGRGGGDDLLAVFLLILLVPAVAALSLIVSVVVGAVNVAHGLMVAGDRARITAFVYAAGGVLFGPALAVLGAPVLALATVVIALGLGVLLLLPSTARDFERVPRLD